MIIYSDTSALAKRYLAETGTAWVRSITDPAGGNTIAIGNITRVEIGSAIARRQHDPRSRISVAERDALIQLFDYHVAHEYLVVDLAPIVIDDAYHLILQHQVRAYDAIQLAAAFTLNTQLVAAGLPALTLVSGDRELLEAARAEGLVTDNPYLHP